MKKPDELITIIDPGEKGRSGHNLGDRAIVQLSNLFAWLFPLLMIAICCQVVLRSSGLNQAWLDDFQWWLYGASGLVAIGYAVTTDSHVRVDIFYENFSSKRKLRIEIFGLVWLFLPFVILSWDTTLPYAIRSIVNDEGSDSPNGLHNLWLLKLFMNVSFIFIGIAVWAAYVRCLAKAMRPRVWKQLLFAFPSTAYIVNLVIYYGIWWFMRLTQPPELTDREISRLPIFGTFEIGSEELKFTVFFALAATIIVIAVAWLVARLGKPADVKGSP